MTPRLGSRPRSAQLTRAVSTPLPLGILALVTAIAAVPVVAGAQAEATGARAPVQVTATDYARAEALIGWNARELVIDERAEHLARTFRVRLDREIGFLQPTQA